MIISIFSASFRKGTNEYIISDTIARRETTIIAHHLAVNNIKTVDGLKFSNEISRHEANNRIYVNVKIKVHETSN